MSLVVAAATGASVFLLVAPKRTARLVERMRLYLETPTTTPDTPSESRSDLSLSRAGLAWTPSELWWRRSLAGAGGAFVGLLLAQGNLFLEGTGRSGPGLAATGAVAGVLAVNVWMTNRRERRAAILRQELPLIADTLSLQVLAGESVATAIEHFIGSAEGVGAAELRSVALDHSEGTGLAEALLAAVPRSAHPDAARLYSLLAEAHQTGGDLAGGLQALATDYRAGLARDLTAEGGKRALAVYAPILALMVPVTLLFLTYPTLAGLRSLAN